MRHTFTLDSIHKTYISQISLFTLKKNARPQIKKALSGVSITLTPGLYGLLGPNGAGKSTLIHIITGTLAPDSGEVLWCGKPATGIAFRRILGYMPQQQGLYDSYTGRRFLAYMAALKEIPRKAVAAEVDRVAAAVNLTIELDKRLSAYSGGMKQRLLLASALLGDPKLLILDEPTAGLDPKERVRLRELLADMAKDRIILVATHVVSDVETVATKVILLRAGKIVDAAPVPELIEKYAPDQGLEDVYHETDGGNHDEHQYGDWAQAETDVEGEQLSRLIDFRSLGYQQLHQLRQLLRHRRRSRIFLVFTLNFFTLNFER